jgi:hypothetical protein
VSDLGADLLQRFAVAQQKAREGIARVMYSTAPDLCFVAGSPKNAVPPVVHLDVIPFIVTDPLAVLPYDLAWRQKMNSGISFVLCAKYSACRVFLSSCNSPSKTVDTSTARFFRVFGFPFRTREIWRRTIRSLFLTSRPCT